MEGQVDRVVVLNQGRKVADGNITELRAIAAIRRAFGCTCLPSSCGCQRPRRLDRMDVGAGELEMSVRKARWPRYCEVCPLGRDVEIVRPSLDELYAAFQTGAP